jgi:hypothetical protein
MTHGNKYPGPYLDANDFKSNGAFASNQAITDCLYIMVSGAFGCVIHDAPDDGGQDPRVPNVEDNTYAQSIGGWSYLNVDYGYAQHPPTDATRAVVTTYIEWTLANVHHHPAS